MPYTDRFIGADYIFGQMTSMAATITDPVVLSNYAGFLSVTAVTVFELAIKDVFYDFAVKKHNSFGFFVGTHFKRINGRIKLDDLRKEHIAAFGQKYLERFKKLLDAKDNLYVLASAGSIKSSYTNLIGCRHSFVHSNLVTLTLGEVISSYNLGKEVIHVLNSSMVR